MFEAKIAAIAIGMTVFAASAAAHDDGRFGSSPLKSWFESLQSGFGKCCTDADGYVVSDVDWDSYRGGYRVRIEDEWVEVPGTAVVTEPNRFGRTMVWKHYIDGHPHVRCFMPGSMS